MPLGKRRNVLIDSNLLSFRLLAGRMGEGIIKNGVESEIEKDFWQSEFPLICMQRFQLAQVPPCITHISLKSSFPHQFLFQRFNFFFLFIFTAESPSPPLHSFVKFFVSLSSSFVSFRKILFVLSVDVPVIMIIQRNTSLYINIEAGTFFAH